MRALFVSNLLPPHALGGYESVCADVADRWRRDGHAVTVLTSNVRRPGIEVVDDAGTRPELPMTHLHAATVPLWRRPAIQRRARHVVDDVVEGLRPDVALVWNMAGLPFATVRRLQERRVPLVFVVGDTWPGLVAASDPWIAPFRGGALRRWLGSFAAVVSGTPTDLPDWGSLGVWAFSSESLRRQVTAAIGEEMVGSLVVPHGIDPVDFPITADRPVSPWGWRLLFVGRLDPSKGIDTLVRALPLLPPDARLEVCAPAEPVHLQRVEGLVDSLGLHDRVRIASAERYQVRERYLAADVCVFPSEWEEPFGLVPLESMATGTPVVASGTGGSGEFLHDGRNCLLAEPGHPDAIADALHRLAADPELRERLVVGGQQTAAAFTVDALAQSLAGVARDLVGAR